MTAYKFAFKPYEYQFSQPLITHHGSWENRQGIILEITDDQNQIGYGEIAPLSWFASETITQALQYCQALPEKITTTDIFNIPDSFPASQFAFESALKDLDKTTLHGEIGPQESTALLPAGARAIEVWPTFWQRGYTTFKWKIAVNSLATEINLFNQLITTLPPTAKLRLDANGGLNLESAKTWLKITDNMPIIEYLEQPLPPDQFEEMLKLSASHQTPIALDESVANFAQMKTCYNQGWRGIFVIKPSIFGYGYQLKDFSKNHEIDLVFSTVFETEIGRKAAIRLARELANLSKQKRALGFG